MEVKSQLRYVRSAGNLNTSSTSLYVTQRSQHEMDYFFVTMEVARKRVISERSKRLLVCEWLESILVRNGPEPKENKNNSLTQTCATLIYLVMLMRWTIYFTSGGSPEKSLRSKS